MPLDLTHILPFYLAEIYFRRHLMIPLLFHFQTVIPVFLTPVHNPFILKKHSPKPFNDTVAIFHVSLHLS